MRERFITLVLAREVPFAQVCARFGISRKTGYKWLNRFRAEGPLGLLERDRAPHSHPGRTAPEVEAMVADLKARQPEWGSARLRAELLARGVEPAPAITTIEAILRRADGSDPAQREGRAAPNDVWTLRMGPVTVSAGLNHRAFVIQDQATRFVLAADVVAERGEEGGRSVLWAAFARHGLPRRLLWRVQDELRAAADSPKAVDRHTPLTVAVLKLGILVEWDAAGVVDAVSDGPEWMGLAQRLRGAAGTDMGQLLRQRVRAGAADPMPLARPPHETLARWRGRLSAWSDQVNLPTTREGGGAAAPAVRYRPSPRRLDTLARSAVGKPAESGQERRVSEKGIFHFNGRRWLVGRAFAGEVVQVRTLPDGDRATVSFGGCPVGLVVEAGPEAAEGLARTLHALETLT